MTSASAHLRTGPGRREAARPRRCAGCHPGPTAAGLQPPFVTPRHAAPWPPGALSNDQGALGGARPGVPGGDGLSARAQVSRERRVGKHPVQRLGPGGGHPGGHDERAAGRDLPDGLGVAGHHGEPRRHGLEDRHPETLDQRRVGEHGRVGVQVKQHFVVDAGIAAHEIRHAESRHELADLVGEPGVGLADQDEPETRMGGPQRRQGFHQDALVLVRPLRSHVQDVAIGKAESAGPGPALQRRRTGRPPRAAGQPRPGVRPRRNGGCPAGPPRRGSRARRRNGWPAGSRRGTPARRPTARGRRRPARTRSHGSPRRPGPGRRRTGVLR